MLSFLTRCDTTCQRIKKSEKKISGSSKKDDNPVLMHQKSTTNSLRQFQTEITWTEYRRTLQNTNRINSNLVNCAEINDNRRINTRDIINKQYKTMHYQKTI